MDLDKFVQKSLQNFTQNKQSGQSLLPKQQATVSYGGSKKQPVPKLYFDMQRDKFGHWNGKWIQQYYLQWTLSIGKEQKKNVTKKIMEEYAEEVMLNRSDRGDEKYINILRADESYITYEFDVDKWMDDNFRSGKPRYQVPHHLDFKIKKSVPLMFYVDASRQELKDFITENFERWIGRNRRLLSDKNFKFLKVIKPEMFDYEVDWQRSRIRASLKYSVILGSLALYTMWKYNKEISRKKERELQREVGRFGDTKKLDKYLDRKL